MKDPTIYKNGNVLDHIDEIIAALKRQDTVTWLDLQLNKPSIVVYAQHSMGRADVMVPNGVGNTNIAHKRIDQGINELIIGEDHNNEK